MNRWRMVSFNMALSWKKISLPWRGAAPRQGRKSGKVIGMKKEAPIRASAFVRIFLAACLAGLAGWGLAGCQTVAATGERRLNLISESQEIQMGREADQQIVASMGLYADPQLEEYVEAMGQKIAATTERPDLPWTFRIVDDDVVNAFALPGGFIYVTRGILSTLTNEAELAGVLGHEIGHVTAKHSVIRISEAQLAQLGLGVASIVSPGLQNYLPLAGIGLQLLFLRFSRDDETQADELGVRYMAGVGEDPRELIGVMQALDAVSKAQGGGAIPEWLSTHPTPANRERRLAEQMQVLGVGERQFEPVDRDGYLRRLSGMVYGKNPREGYSRGSTFYHPDLQFLLVFPQEWKVVNQKQAVVGISPQQDAAIQLSLARESTVGAAAQGLFNQEGVTPQGVRRISVNGLPAEIGTFTAQTDQGILQGQAAFISYGDRVFQILGYSGQPNWPRYAGAVQDALYSFNRLTDPQALSVQPMRLQVQEVSRRMTLEELNGLNPSAIPIEELALINRMQPDTVLEAGQLVKRITGRRLE